MVSNQGITQMTKIGPKVLMPYYSVFVFMNQPGYPVKTESAFVSQNLTGVAILKNNTERVMDTDMDMYNPVVSDCRVGCLLFSQHSLKRLSVAVFQNE